MPKNTVSCTNIYKTFQDAGKAIIVLEGLSLQVDAGESVAIIGRSGSGKTTLLNILGGLELPTTGEVSIAGNIVNSLNEAKRTHLRNHFLGFIFQSHHLLPEFTALENVCMPLLIRGMAPRTAKGIGESFLTKVGLEERMTHKPAILSGGERQRVAIARALVTKPKCILADEPTGNLDDRNTNQIYDLMVTITKEVGTSFIVVTHDLHLAKRMNRQLLLENGQLKPVSV
jgi:lipoprotein-releasing system ATP-binding protein